MYYDTVALKMSFQGPHSINIKITYYQNTTSYCGGKTILWPSYLHNGISYNSKITSLYWIGAMLSKGMLNAAIIHSIGSLFEDRWVIHVSGYLSWFIMILVLGRCQQNNASWELWTKDISIKFYSKPKHYIRWNISGHVVCDVPATGFKFQAVKLNVS